MKLFLISVLGIGVAGLCQAATLYDVVLNTASLQGNPSGPFALDFQLTSGNTASGVANYATLSQFDFGIGGSGGTGSPFPNSGNAGGTGSIIALSTYGGVFFNEFSEYFMPGNKLEFQLYLSNNAQPTLTPDEFTFQLIDSTGNEINTTDTSGSNSLVVIDLTGAPLIPQTYMASVDGVSISPVVELAAPEPRSEPILSAIILLVAISRGRSERKSQRGKQQRS